MPSKEDVKTAIVISENLHDFIKVSGEGVENYHCSVEVYFLILQIAMLKNALEKIEYKMGL